jgi:hypothetical protein
LQILKYSIREYFSYSAKQKGRAIPGLELNTAIYVRVNPNLWMAHIVLSQRALLFDFWSSAMVF